MLALSAIAVACAHTEVASQKENPAQTSPRRPASVQLTVANRNPAHYRSIFAISDVHGELANLVNLLRAANLIDQNNRWIAHRNHGRTLLVVIGDSIDKGPESLEALDLWIQLQPQAAAQGDELLHLLGNHEAEFMADTDDQKNDKKDAATVSDASADHYDLSNITNCADARGKFVCAEPVALKLGGWFFAHAGKFPQASWSTFETAIANCGKTTQEVDGNNATVSAYKDKSANAYNLVDNDSILEASDWWTPQADGGGRAAQYAMMAQAGFYGGTVFGHQPEAFKHDAKELMGDKDYVIGKVAAVDNMQMIKIDSGMAPNTNIEQAGQPTPPVQMIYFPNPKELNLSTPASFHRPVVKTICAAHPAVAGDQYPCASSTPQTLSTIEEIAKATTPSGGDGGKKKKKHKHDHNG
jgi:hypothetical protein